MKLAVLGVIDKVDQLPPRDRMSMAAGLVAALIGLEVTVLMPMATKRNVIAQSVQAQTDSETEARTAARTEQQQRLDALTQRQKELEAKLAAIGLHQLHRDALADFVQRAASSQGAVLTGLRALPIEELQVATAVAADPAAAAAPQMFRHRAEVTIEGPAVGVAQSIGLLEHKLKPLRVESVQLTADPQGGIVRARVVLTTISQERTWLAL